MSEQILKLKEKLQKTGTRGLALDIDETLSFTNGYWIDALLEKLPHPSLTKESILREYFYIERVPHWQTKEAYQLMVDFMHSNEFQKDIPLIENANHIVNRINKKIPIVAYITARPEVVRKGTEFWLRKHGFPKADIILKPHAVPFERKNEWKAEVVQRLHPEIIGIVDDNPGLADALSGDYQGTLYLYDNIKHPRKDIRVVPCKTWNDVASAIHRAE